MLSFLVVRQLYFDLPTHSNAITIRKVTSIETKKVEKSHDFSTFYAYQGTTIIHPTWW